MKYCVYAITGEVPVKGKFEERTWLGFYQYKTIWVEPENYVPVAIAGNYKFLGRLETDFPIKYPIELDNGLVIKEDDYYREYKDVHI